MDGWMDLLVGTGVATALEIDLDFELSSVIYWSE